MMVFFFGTLCFFIWLFKRTVFPQCQWVYRAFEDIEELERQRGVGKKEESSFRPYTVENGSDHEDNGTNGTGETQHYIL